MQNKQTKSTELSGVACEQRCVLREDFTSLSEHSPLMTHLSFREQECDTDFVIFFRVEVQQQKQEGGVVVVVVVGGGGIEQSCHQRSLVLDSPHDKLQT